LALHPCTAYGLLAEVRGEGHPPACAEARRLAAEFLLVTLLRALGFRWPAEAGAANAAARWPEGVALLGEGAGAAGLERCLPALLAPGARAGADPDGAPLASRGARRPDPSACGARLQGLAAALGAPLELWLRRDLPREAASRFRQCPPLWLLASPRRTLYALLLARRADASGLRCVAALARARQRDHLVAHPRLAADAGAFADLVATAAEGAAALPATASISERLAPLERLGLVPPRGRRREG
jgi:hypothetical protein